MIPYFRVYSSSILNYLKYEILPPHYTETLVDQTLVYDTDLGGYVAEDIDQAPSPTGEGRGWVFFDETTVDGEAVVDLSGEQTSQVSVAGASSYTISYPQGIILDPDTVPTSVSYGWNYVSVIQGWPGEQPPELPVVALVFGEDADKAGYQLGGGTKDIIKGSAYIFATDEGEKQDITDLIYNAFYNRTLAIKNWHEGSYLDYDGTFTGFSPTTISGVTSGYFTGVTASLSVPNRDWSELNRYRSRVSFTFEIFKDR